MPDRENPQSSPRQVAGDVPDAARDPLRGTPYRFVCKLSDSGAMGQVVEAEQIALRKRVVIKLIRGELAGSAGFVDRMRLEAEALGAISPHPHVVTVLDLGRTPDGRAYLVMEKLVGRTLGDELATRGFIPVDEAVALGFQLLSGLGAAHGVGVVHRDIKPDNLFLCDPARGPRVLKILDFGIAKVVGEQAEAGRPAPLAQPTAQGLMVGTPRFCAPEQAAGLPIDHRADIYAVGAVLYALVAGRDPFHHHHILFNLLRAQVSEAPPPPSRGAPQVIPEEVERAIMKALQKRPEDRWGSAAEFGEALARALRPSPQRWLMTEPIDTRSFRARGPERAAQLPPEAPREVATLRLQGIGAASHQAMEPTICAPSPPGPRASSVLTAGEVRRRAISLKVAVLFALVACAALVEAFGHLLWAR